MKRELGQTTGPAISDKEGVLFNQGQIDELLTEVLEEMYENDPTSFPAEVDEKDKITQFYHCFRTFRRTSDTRAIDVGVSRDDIDVINCWEKKEKAGSKKSGMSMKQHYADFQMLIQPFKRYGLQM